jgi:hypothetical protein
MAEPISDHASLIVALGGASVVASAVEALPVTVRAWSARNRIPPEHWEGIISLGDNKGVAVDAHWLMCTTPARGGASKSREAASLVHAEQGAA